MTNKDQIQFSRLAEAMVQSEAMEETHDYLRRGRRFASLESANVSEDWTIAIRQWLIDLTPDSQRQMDDLASELRLRNLEPSYESLAPELKILSRQMAADYEANGMPEEVLAKIARFKDSINRPKN